jgi:putative SOS response-associated peptidase YedK
MEEPGHLGMETFSIITTDPNQVVAPLHNRMPVILERKDYERWLGGGPPGQPPLDLLRPFPAEQMSAWKVDKGVGNVRNDSAHMLEPLPGVAAHGAGDAGLFGFIEENPPAAADPTPPHRKSGT